MLRSLLASSNVIPLPHAPHVSKVPHASYPSYASCLSFLSFATRHGSIYPGMVLALQIFITVMKVHQLVRFLSIEDQGAVGIPDIIEILREFQDMVRDVPSLGAAPMTVVDPSDLDILARSCFSEMLQSRRRRQSVNNPTLISQENVPRSEDEGHRTSGSRDHVKLNQPERCAKETRREGQPICVERTPSPHECPLAFPAEENRVAEDDTVTAEDISAAFDEAARMAKGSTQDASGAGCDSLIRDPVAKGYQSQVGISSWDCFGPISANARLDSRRHLCINLSTL